VKSWKCVFLQRWVNHPLSLSQAHAKAETMAFEKRKPSNMKVATTSAQMRFDAWRTEQASNRQIEKITK
jgi:hypothetical protein